MAAGDSMEVVEPFGGTFPDWHSIPVTENVACCLSASYGDGFHTAGKNPALAPGSSKLTLSQRTLQFADKLRKRQPRFVHPEAVMGSVRDADASTLIQQDRL